MQEILELRFKRTKAYVIACDAVKERLCRNIERLSQRDDILPYVSGGVDLNVVVGDLMC